MKLEESNEEDIKFTKEIHDAADLGFSKNVLSRLHFAIGGDGTGHEWEIKRVDEKFFLPSREYVQQSVFRLQQDVLEDLAKNSCRKSLYMIVGVRICRDATPAHTTPPEIEGNLKATVPFAPTGVRGVLARILPGIKCRSIPDSFVFAYRLREVCYYVKKTDANKGEGYTKSANLHNRGKVVQRSSTRAPTDLGTVGEIEVEGISGEDFRGDQHDIRKTIDGCIMVDLHGTTDTLEIGRSRDHVTPTKNQAANAFLASLARATYVAFEAAWHLTTNILGALAKYFFTLVNTLLVTLVLSAFAAAFLYFLHGEYRAFQQATLAAPGWLFNATFTASSAFLGQTYCRFPLSPQWGCSRPSLFPEKLSEE